MSTPTNRNGFGGRVSALARKLAPNLAALFSRKMRRRCLFVLASLVTLFALFCAIERWRGRAALRSWKTEMIAKGEKFEIEELAPPPSEEARKKTRLFYDAADALTNQFHFSAIPWDLLGSKIIATQGCVRVNWPLIQTDADKEKLRKFAAEVEDIGPALKRLRETLRDPPQSTGEDYRPAILRYGFGIRFLEKRMVAQALLAAAYSAMQQGHREEALDNFHGLTSLLRLHQDDPMFVNLMVRVALANLGIQGTWDLLRAPGWTEDQLARLQEDWEGLNFLAQAAKSFETERASAAFEIEFCRHATFRKVMAEVYEPRVLHLDEDTPAPFDEVVRDYIHLQLWKLAWSEQDELFHSRLSQPVIESLRSAAVKKSWMELRRESETQEKQFSQDFTGWAGVYNRARYNFSQRSFISAWRAEQRIMQLETDRQMAIAAIALKRYQLRHGKLPPSLDALVPEFLSAVPLDYMDGKPLRYRLNPDGTFVLYSVGFDGQDHGGDDTIVKARYGSSGMPRWDARDAVWPQIEVPMRTGQTKR